MCAERSPSAAKERAAIRERELSVPLAHGERIRRVEQLLARFGGLVPPGLEARREIAEKIKAQVDVLAGGVAADRLPDPAQKALQTWVGRIKEAEREDATLFGIVLPGDSSLAVVLVGMEEAAYAGDPEFDSRVPVSAAVSRAEPPEGDREAELHDAIELVRRALNQLTDHGSQRCMECLAHRKNGLDALERLDRGMRWMERRDA